MAASGAKRPFAGMLAFGGKADFLVALPDFWVSPKPGHGPRSYIPSSYHSLKTSDWTRARHCAICPVTNKKSATGSTSIKLTEAKVAG